MKHTLIRTTPKMDDGLLVDRRATLRWMAAAMATIPLAACGESQGGLTWAEPRPLTGPGYGRDPDMLEPSYPWPLTLTRNELLTVTALVDLIMPADGENPAASAVGVPGFIDEWVSAPYPSQQADRALILPGLAWLDEQAMAGSGRRFGHTDEAGRAAVADRIAWKDRVEPGLEKPAAFFARMRALTMGAYYTSEHGWKEIGYLGNRPASGDYAGPPSEAIEHLKGVLAGMGLAYNPNFDPVRQG